VAVGIVSHERAGCSMSVGDGKVGADVCGERERERWRERERGVGQRLFGQSTALTSGPPKSETSECLLYRPAQAEVG
jgi:hypothetical protein